MAKKIKYDAIVANNDLKILSMVVEKIRENSFAHVRSCEEVRGLIACLIRRPYDAVVLCDTIDAPDWRRIVRMLRSGRFCFPDVPIILVCQEASGKGLSVIAQNHNVHTIALSEIDYIHATIRYALAQVPKSRILIIEDDPAIAVLASKALEKDFSITVCNDGEQALAEWGANDFDLVLLDLMLPDISGEQILERIIEQNPEQLVVIITAHGNIDRHQRLIEMGAFDFVDKPFDINRLRLLCLQMMSERLHTEADRGATEIRRKLSRLSQRVHAASADLKRGRVAIASRHLDHACIEQPMDLTDDEWTELISEFDK